MIDVHKFGRRWFLGGAGAAISLPFLESLLPRARARAQQTAPLRFVGYFFPFGTRMRDWTPTAVGANYPLSPNLAPLGALEIRTGVSVKDEVIVLSGLKHLGRGHSNGCGAFLTAIDLPEVNQPGGRTDDTNRISFDQAYADVVGRATPLRSLELGTQNRAEVGACNGGFPCTYQKNISWSGPGLPRPPILDAARVFDILFAGFDPGATVVERDRRVVYRRSVLDYVREDASQLTMRLGPRDRARLEQYLTAIRELELRISGDPADYRPPRGCNLPVPVASGVTRQRTVELMTDLIALAFQCDRTRAVTFMLGETFHQSPMDVLGDSEHHHQMTHEPDNPESVARANAMVRWEVEQFGRLVQQLGRIEDVDGNSVLHNSILYFSSDVGELDNHLSENMPALVAGRAGGRITPGRHVMHTSGTDADMFFAFAQMLGIPGSGFGESTRALGGWT